MQFYIMSLHHDAIQTVSFSQRLGRAEYSLQSGTTLSSFNNWSRSAHSGTRCTLIITVQYVQHKTIPNSGRKYTGPGKHCLAGPVGKV